VVLVSTSVLETAGRASIATGVSGTTRAAGVRFNVPVANISIRTGSGGTCQASGNTPAVGCA
jgi:hypothetical protein